MKTYEIAIYNQEVRKLVAEGRRHRNLSDAWADTHYIEIKANSPQEARAKLASRYPAENGYVIEEVLTEKFAD
ncbi:hypothetical protein [Shumkonia mesophila]|uniref:hypothetical protein n=1 Tax=Shumkonia mesophila TaxID=2838854 RepID=UPI0029344B25|nr:hypothetical protein [Shumkonia mesophila]